jgi:uncharacterized protein YbjQ (UPF0145 family)
MKKTGKKKLYLKQKYKNKNTKKNDKGQIYLQKHTKKRNVFLNNNKTKKAKEIFIFEGGAWYSYFLPSTWFQKKNDDDNTLNQKLEEEEDKLKPETNEDNDDTKTVISEEYDETPETTDKKEEEKNEKVKSVRYLYDFKTDDQTIEKEFFDNPDITTHCVNDSNLKPVGTVHLTSVVGINILREYVTGVKNLVGLKATIDENMHILRNQIMIEIEKIMKKKKINKVCGIQIAFTKDKGTLLLNAFGTALRYKKKYTEEQ